MASILADDINHLLEYRDNVHPGNVLPDTPTTYNFRGLQKQLATFNDPDKYDLIKTMMDNLHITGNKTTEDRIAIRHPFLEEVMRNKYDNVIELYKAYIYARQDYFLHLEEQVLSDIRSHKPLRQMMFHQFKKKWEDKNDKYYSDLGKRYQEHKNKNSEFSSEFFRAT